MWHVCAHCQDRKGSALERLADDEAQELEKAAASLSQFQLSEDNKYVGQATAERRRKLLKEAQEKAVASNKRSRVVQLKK
jgi:hypothetical protein